MNTETCVHCKTEIDEFNENELFVIKNLPYCSIACIYDKDKEDSKIQNSSQTNKGNKRQKQVHKKKSKQKKGKKK